MIQSFFAGNRKKLAAKLPIEHFIFSAFLNLRILDGVQQLRKVAILVRARTRKLICSLHAFSRAQKTFEV